MNPIGYIIETLQDFFNNTIARKGRAGAKYTLKATAENINEMAMDNPKIIIVLLVSEDFKIKSNLKIVEIIIQAAKKDEKI